jgi:hypothetical protein
VEAAVKTTAAILGAVMVLVVMLDAFETIVLPRRSARRIRPARIYYIFTWRRWVTIAKKIKRPKQRENFLGYYGPLSLLTLLAYYAAIIIFGYALVYWSLGSAEAPGSGWTRLGYDLYISGATFFTLGVNDLTPHSPAARAFTVFESGLGFAFLAVLIGYVPVIYQAFSRREVNISMLDARAGSPPSAGELLRRHARDHETEALQGLLRDWERWSADLMESHLSYAVLCYFRSQHDNQSWLAALCTVLDTCALVMAGIEGACQRQAELTFAMTRHALVDLSAIFISKPPSEPYDRLPPELLARLRSEVKAAGLSLHDNEEATRKLREYRRLYEPYVLALSEFLLFRVPDWLPPAAAVDNWQTSRWGRERSFWRDIIREGSPHRPQPE